MRHLYNQLAYIAEGTLRERIAAKLALMSQLLHQQPKGDRQYMCLALARGRLPFKGKGSLRHEFGYKVIVATTPDDGFLVGLRSFRLQTS